MAEDRDTEARWYVVHTYSGYENKVAQNLETIVENRRLQELIHEVKVPVELVPDIKDGKEREVERKLFPGYVLVKMVMTDDSWYIVRNTRGVTGFVGPSSKPIPLTDEEVDKLGVDVREVSLDYAVGDNVQIMNGPLEGFIGIVEGIDTDAKKVNVKVSMFGRETPAELDFTQVKRFSGKSTRCKALFLIERAKGIARSWEGLGNPAKARNLPQFLEVHKMAQKVTGYIKLQIPAGKATPAPPVGPALGQHGVNIMAFTKEFNERTQKDIGYLIPVVITVYADRSFSFITKTPPAAVLIKKAVGIESGSGVPNKTKVASITKKQLEEIASTKMPDLNAANLETAISMIAGTCRSMGVTVTD